MNEPIASRLPDGDFLLRDLTPWFLAELLRLPDLLRPDQPEHVRDRLYPLASEGDEASQEEWRRLVHPELFALLASARAVVEHDLESLDLGEGDEPGRLVIPAGHVQAWISALNAARLTLAELHGVGQEEMNAAESGLPTDLGQEVVMAIARIHLLAWLQEALILTDQPRPGEER